MRQDASELLTRAAAVIAAARFGSIAASTVQEYRAVAERLDGERLMAGPSWPGPLVADGSRNTNAVRRAAWARKSAHEVARALDDLRQRRVSADEAVDRLATWVLEAERTPSLPRGDVMALRGRRPAGARPVRSKRGGLRELPTDWLQQLWTAAVDGEHRHLDVLAVMLVTGCRPQEAAWSVAARRIDGDIEVVVAGAKVTAEAGQAWRRLTVADDGDGPAAHLLRLADAAPEGVARIGAACTPGALSMAVTVIGARCGFQRRVSAYDVRHQRCADVRVVFGGDLERVGAWLGHAGTRNTRHYGCLPGGGCRGARPIGVETSAPVRVRGKVLSRSPATPAC